MSCKCLQVSDLISQPCFKVQLGHNKKAFYLLIIAPWALNLFCGQTTSISIKYPEGEKHCAVIFLF